MGILEEESVNREIALLFAHFAAMGLVALVFWFTQSILLAVGLTAAITAATCGAWRWVEGDEAVS